MRRKIWSVIAGAVAISLSAAAYAAERRKAAEPEPPPPPPFRIDVATRPMGLERFAVSINSGTLVGEYFTDMLCISSPAVIYTNNVFHGGSAADYRASFAEEATKAGYNVPQGTGNLFGSEASTKPELLVGAAIIGLKEHGCRSPNIISSYTITMDATIQVDWQVYDPLEKKLLFRATTEGKGRSKITNNNFGAGGTPVDAARAAFQDAARVVLQNPEFLAAVKDPRGGAPAQPGALFPEASATPSQTSSGAIQIPRLPLRTREFKEQVDELRKQVVTIRTPSGSGSGFYIAEGLLLTNQHVIEGHSDVKVRFLGGKEVAGHVVTSNARRDVALVKTENVGVTGLSLRTETPELTSRAFVIGSPLGQENEGTISSGIISAFRTMEGNAFIQSDAAITNGNSGGAMFDEKGNVIAITVLTRLNAQGAQVSLNYFIPIADALDKLHIAANLPASASPVMASAPMSGSAVALSAMSAPPTPSASAPMAREIKVSMFPAIGPVKDSGHTAALAGTVGGTGTSGTFTFARPDGVSCNGKWTTLLTKPASSLIEKYKNQIGLPTDTAGLVGGIAIGSCSNAGSFQAEYYTVPTADSGFGAATDSDGNIYKLIF